MIFVVRIIGVFVYDLLLVFSLIFTLIGIAVLCSINGEIIFWIITLPATYFYFVYSLVKGGQTLGMKAWKIKIIQPSYLQASLWFLATVALISAIVALIKYIHLIIVGIII